MSTSGGRPSLNTILFCGICAALLACFATLAFRASAQKSPTYDEPLHLVSAWATLHDGDFRCDAEDPPLWKYWAVAGTRGSDLPINFDSRRASAMLNRPDYEWPFAIATLYQPGANSNALWPPVRARMLALAVALGAVVALWAWRLAGPHAAVAALLVFCFDPNFMAHGPILKNDVAIALAVLLLIFSVWLLGKCITIPRVLAVGLCLAIALTTKFSGVLMIPTLAILLVARALLPQPWPSVYERLDLRRQRLAAAGLILLAAIIFAWAGIWACYRGQLLPTPTTGFNMPYLSNLVVINESRAREISHPTSPEEEIEPMRHPPQPGLMARTLLTMERLHLLPQAYIAGILYTYANSIVRPSFLLDHVYHLGSWNYFPVAIAVKTPLATLTAILLALAGAALLRRKSNSPKAPDHLRSWTIICLAVPPAFYMAWAMSSSVNIGLRHVLLVYPFAFIAVGAAAAWAWPRRPLATGLLAACLATILVIENLTAYPDYIPFFNAAAGGERGGLHLLSDSNLDWGQDLPALADWQHRHPDIPLLLCYFGQADPKHYGIRYVNLAGSFSYADLPSAPPGPAMIAISATQLQKTYMPRYPPEIAPALQGQPAEVLGGSIYLFPINLTSALAGK